MESYYQKLLVLINKIKGTSDVMSIEYDEFFNDLDKESFDNQLTIGNINLISGNFVSPKENNEIVDKFITTDLP